jgi:RHS repeat-associated protein
LDRAGHIQNKALTRVYCLLIVGINARNAFGLLVIRDPHRPSLVTRHDYAFNGSGFLWYACGHDILGRVTNACDSLSVARAFLYNTRSEVTGAAVGTDTLSYLFDGIGNRVTAAINGLTNTYAANSLNQYTAAGSAFPAYDTDGNMLSDGTFAYAWDAENRLVSAAPVNPSSGSRRVFCRYDWHHRLVQLTVQTYSSGAWVPHETRSFVYDGWLLSVELVDRADSSSQTIEYFWGSDLSGTEQGGGGVGGLVAVSIDGTYHIPCYDHNGNVTAYVSESGTVSAQYLYDVFGNTLEQSGPLADTFRHRFSTKYFIPESHSYYYGYRHYAPKLGCWLSKDPIGERGGMSKGTYRDKRTNRRGMSKGTYRDKRTNRNVKGDVSRQTDK